MSLNLGGFPVILFDTAGLRETADVIENEGVKRAMYNLLHSQHYDHVTYLISQKKFERESIDPSSIGR